MSKFQEISNTFFTWAKGRYGLLGRNFWSVVISDGLGAIASFAALYSARKLFADPVDRCESWIKDHFVRPNFRWLDKCIKTTGEFHKLDEIEDQEKTIDGKEKAIAKFATETALAGGVGYVTSLYTHYWTDQKLGVNNTKLMIRGSRWTDIAVHLGAFAVINSALAKETKFVMAGVSNILQAVGVSKETADGFTRWAISMELPNVVGAAAAWASLVAFGAKAAPVHK